MSAVQASVCCIAVALDLAVWPDSSLPEAPSSGYHAAKGIVLAMMALLPACLEALFPTAGVPSFAFFPRATCHNTSPHCLLPVLRSYVALISPTSMLRSTADSSEHVVGELVLMNARRAWAGACVDFRSLRGGASSICLLFATSSLDVPFPRNG